MRSNLKTVFLFFVFTLLVIESAAAATFTVSNANDAGAGSLRQAIISANGSGGADIISIVASGTLTLTSALPAITESVTITGPGTASFIVNGGNLYRVFEVSTGTVSISALTVKDGRGTGGNGGLGSGGGGGGLGAGGGIFIGGGTVTLSDVFFDGNDAVGGSGGGSDSGSYGGGGGGGRDANGTTANIGFGSCHGANGGGPSGGTGGAEPGGSGVAGGDYSGGGGGGCWQNNDGGPGGVGGFGGGGAGGGYEHPHGAAGGFGGGGGGGANSFFGARGLGGGNGGNCSGCVPGGAGGGGAGLGGAIFVRDGASLTISYGSGTASATVEQNGTVAGGSGGGGVLSSANGASGQGAGTFAFLQGNAHNLAISVASGFTRTISGAIADETAVTSGTNTGTLAKSGAGKLILSAAQSYSGATTVSDGTLQVDGSVGQTTVQTAATLGGSGMTGVTTVNSGGTLSPGASAGALHTGNLALATGSTFAVELNGTGAGTTYDQVAVTGTVNIIGATANISTGYTPAPGDSYTLIENDGGDAVTGTFNGWANGAELSFGGKVFTINYSGGSGNDVVITSVQPEIDVKGNSISIVSGDTSPASADGTDFGALLVNSSASKSYQISNSGTTALNISGSPRVTLSGAGASQFSLTSAPAASVAISGNTSFTLRFLPTSAGLKTATVTVTSDDLSEPTYTYSIQGLGDIDTDGDTIPDSVDTDDDGDGVSDTQEQTDGTNSLDSGSVLPVLSTNFCSEWNGFLGGLWNILELVNFSAGSRTLECSLKNTAGDTQSISSYALPAGRQFDALVHDFPGWMLNSYGQVCVDVTNGIPGDVDGRMVYYKSVANDIQFAFALPYQDGLKGSQFVPFNTFQPSLDPADANNFVANWVQLLNLESTSQSGTMISYGQDGSILGSEGVTLAAGARRDFSGHQFGKNLIGLMEWRPDTASSHFQMKNIRYFYDNAQLIDTFDGAFVAEGQHGTGELITAPVEKINASAVLEMGNTANANVAVTIKVYGVTGSLMQTINTSLAPYSSAHFVLDPILLDSRGTVTVDSSVPASIIAQVVNYGRTENLGIKSVFALAAKQPLGSVVHGSYNTFLGQSCKLLVASTVAQNVQISVSRADGTQVLNGTSVPISANGYLETFPCTADGSDNYGVVTVQPDNPNTIIADVVRSGAGDNYRFATPVR